LKRGGPGKYYLKEEKEELKKAGEHYITYNLPKCYSDDHIKQDEMGGACSASGK
jgi:hypothetical protein